MGRSLHPALYFAQSLAEKKIDLGHLPAPTTEDDLYGLGLSICELYTGEMPHGEYASDDEVVKETLLEGGTGVDSTKIDDEDVRDVVKGLFRQGGAHV